MRIRRLPALGALALSGCSTTAAGLTPADRTGLPDHACLLGPVTKRHGCHVSHGLPDRACTLGTVSIDVARGEL